MNDQVMVLELVEGFYKATTFHTKEMIQSKLFPELALTVEQILNTTDRPSSSPEPHRPPDA